MLLAAAQQGVGSSADYIWMTGARKAAKKWLTWKPIAVVALCAGASIGIDPWTTIRLSS